jgi:hypothetical protein
MSKTSTVEDVEDIDRRGEASLRHYVPTVEDVEDIDC